MNDNDIKIICEKIESLHDKILKNKFAEKVTESEMLSMVLVVMELNRQKAEIERLNRAMDTMIIEHKRLIANARAEAKKEFAERLKESAFACDVSFGYGREHCEEAVTVLEIDNLAKEMTEETP